MPLALTGVWTSGGKYTYSIYVNDEEIPLEGIDETSTGEEIQAAIQKVYSERARLSWEGVGCSTPKP